MDNLEEWDLSMKDVIPRLKHLVVHDCRKLRRIPALGNLELLETLEISGISSLECIGGEFLGISNGESIPTVVFPKLKKLEFEFMNEWEEWEMMTTRDITIMSCLQELKLHHCPMLKSLPECIMSSSTIRELTISVCPLLMWTQSCLPPLLETLILQHDASDLLKEIPASNSLKSLTITSAECVSLPRGLAQLKSLEKLSISYCNNVEYMPQELQDRTSLQELDIYHCNILGPRCQKEVGEDWNIISHIPTFEL